jgi:hypothetical protein
VNDGVSEEGECGFGRRKGRNVDGEDCFYFQQTMK